MNLTCEEIRRLFWNEYKKINIKKYRKVHFEIFLCETDGKRDLKTSYKFNGIDYIDYDNKNIYLKNRFGRIKKVLNRNNVVWLSCINIYDGNLEFKLCDYDYATIKVVEV